MLKKILALQFFHKVGKFSTTHALFLAVILQMAIYVFPPKNVTIGPEIYYAMARLLNFCDTKHYSKNINEYQLGLTDHTIQNAFDWQRTTGMPIARQASYIVANIIYKLKLWSLYIFPFYPTFFSHFIFALGAIFFVSRTVKNLTNDRLLGLTVFPFMLSLPSILSTITFSHSTGKPMSLFFCALLFYLVSRLKPNPNTLSSEEPIKLRFDSALLIGFLLYLSFMSDDSALAYPALLLLFALFLFGFQIRFLLKFIFVMALALVGYVMTVRWVLPSTLEAFGIVRGDFVQFGFSNLIERARSYGILPFIGTFFVCLAKTIGHQLGLAAWNWKNPILYLPIIALISALHDQRKKRDIFPKESRTELWKWSILLLMLPTCVGILTFAHLWLGQFNFTETYYYGLHFSIVYSLFVFLSLKQFLNSSIIQRKLAGFLILLSLIQFQAFHSINQRWRTMQWEKQDPQWQTVEINRIRKLALDSNTPKPIEIKFSRNYSQYSNLVIWVMLRVFEERGLIKYADSPYFPTLDDGGLR